ncbi:hypothetical protein QTP88_000335 [Uroleucon formosanum]
MTIVRANGKEYYRHQLIIPEFLGPTIYLSFPSRSRFIPLPPPPPLPPLPTPHPLPPPHPRPLHSFPSACDHRETRNLKKKHHPSPNKGNQTFPRTPSRSASEATDADIISRVIQTSKKVLCTKGTSAV